MSSVTKPINAAPIKVTAAVIRGALKRTFPHPDYGVCFEVAQATGHSAHRHLDAIVMHTWPSRGLAITGIEIKVDIYDYRRELKDPEKAEQLARFCDEFCIAAPCGLIDVQTLPRAWGLIEFDADTGMMRSKKKPETTPAQAVTREFLAACFRAFGRPIDPESLDGMLEARIKELNDDFNERVKSEAARLSTRATQDALNWRKLIDALGDDAMAQELLGHQSRDADNFIKCVATVAKTGVHDAWQGLAGLQSSTRNFLEKIDGAMAMFDVEHPFGSAGYHAAKKTKKKPKARGAK